MHRFHLFIRANKKNVELNPAGPHLRRRGSSAHLRNTDRAVHAAREGSGDSILTIDESLLAEHVR